MERHESQRESQRLQPEGCQAGERLRCLLLLAGFTEEQAAIGLGVPEQTVWDWCNGKGAPPQEVLQALERLAALQQRLG